MNITSLLQEAPSLDRTRRNKQQSSWDESMSNAAKPETSPSLSHTSAPGSRTAPPSEPPLWTSSTISGSSSSAFGAAGLTGRVEARDGDFDGRYKMDNLAQRDQQQHKHQGHGFDETGLDSGIGPSTQVAYKPSILETGTVITETPVDSNAVNPITIEPLLPPPRTPSPSLAPVHLGTFVYPFLPFPITRNKLPYNRRTTVSILIPSPQLPATSSNSTGVPDSTTNANGQTEPNGNEEAVKHTTRIPPAWRISHLSDPRARKIWGGIPFIDERKVYTDDSDLIYAALHSGILNVDKEGKFNLEGEAKEGNGRSKEREADLELILRLYPAPEYGRYVGGEGANGLSSGSWGNSHEGCAFMIKSAKWVPSHTARSYTRQTRKARMKEYALLRAEAMNPSLLPIDLVPSQPSQDLAPSIFDLLKPAPVKREVDPLEYEISSLSFKGGWQESVTFQYSPLSLYLMLFAFDPTAQPPTKRRKLNDPTSVSSTPSTKSREIVLLSSDRPKQRLLLVHKAKPARTDGEDAEMQVDGADNEKKGAPIVVTYDLVRETQAQPSLAALKDPSAIANLSTGGDPKGVRFSDDTKTGALEEEKWDRELLHSDLGVSDIAFAVEGIEVAEVRYRVEEWSWKSARYVLDKKGMKAAGKRRKVRRKTKAAVAVAPAEQKTAASNATEGTVGETKDAAPDVAKESLPKDSKKEPTPTTDDKEEGELSG